MFKRYRIKIKALWFDPTVGEHGALGAVLVDGTQVYLCSKEKWDLGRSDSLRVGWQNNKKIFARPKTMYCDYSEKELREYGLGKLTPFE